MNADLHEPIGTAAARHEGLRMLFEELGLDYYCEGHLSIQEAVAAAGLGIETVGKRIEDLPAKAGPNWPDRSLADLIAHLEIEHHATTRDRIGHSAVLVAEACQNDARLPAMRADLRRLNELLIMHIEREELLIFPAILALESAWTRGQPPPGTEGGMRKLTARAVLEHFDIVRRLRELRSARLAFGHDAPSATLRLFAAMAELERHLHESINLENYVAFPRAIALEDALYSPSPAFAPAR